MFTTKGLLQFFMKKKLKISELGLEDFVGESLKA
jgi:hypothetical protein